MDSLNNVCRLCSETRNLKWVFDKKLDCVEKVDLVNVISTITGIEILAEDIISQNICTECYQISIGIDQFRVRARKNNEFLMDRYNEMLKTSSVVREIPINDVKKKVEQGMITEATNEPNHTIHQSVKELLKLFPRLNLPSTCLNSNIDPSIVLDEGAVKNFLKKDAKNRHLSVRLLKPSHRNDEKRISAATVSMPMSPLCMNFEKTIENGKNTAKPKKRRHDRAFPKKKPIGEFAEGLCLAKSVPLFICNICDAVHNNGRELKMHRFKHLRCPFCRSNFKTMDSKVAHLKSMCAIKNMSINLPSVELEKIELDQTIRTKYPKAFVGHSLISELQLNPRSTGATPEHEVSREDTVGCYDDDGVSDIFADTRLKPENELITQSGISSSLLQTKSKVAENVFSAIPVIARPDITIENSEVLDKLDTRLSDIDIFRQLLSETTALHKEESSCSQLICVNGSGDTSGFLSKPAVIKKNSEVSKSVFTVTPIVSATPSVTPIFPAVLSTTSSIVSSSRSTVTESTNCQQPHQPGRLCQWNDLNSLDANEVNKSNVNESSFHRNPEINPAVISENLPTPRIGSNCIKTAIHSSNVAFLAVPNQPASSSISRSSTPAEFSNKLSSVHHQVVSTNFETINMNLRSKKRYLLVKKEAASIPKSATNTSNSPTSNLVAKDPTFVSPEAAMTVLQPPIFSPTEVATDGCSTPGATSEPTTYPFDFSLSREMNQRTNHKNNRFSTPVNSSKTMLHPSNTPVFAVPMCSMNRFSTPANSRTELSTVHRHIVSSNLGMLHKDPGSRKRYILVRKVSKQQSNTVTSFTTPNAQMYPNSANITYGLSDPTSVNPSVANMAGLQTPVSYPYDMRSAANVSLGFPNLAADKKNHVVNHSTVNNSPNATHSAIYKRQKSLAVQNKIPCAVPNREPVAATSGRVFGRIRVRSLRELM